jgi:cytosine/adenosine deaminase-related metal-dependent hydrolase
MFEETRTAYYRNRESTGPVPPSRMMEMLSAGYALASEHLGAGFGRFAEGSPADFTVLDYRPPTPVTDDTLTAHLLLGVNALAVESVMINGRWITWNRGFVALDEEQVLGDARKVAERLWRIK